MIKFLSLNLFIIFFLSNLIASPKVIGVRCAEHIITPLAIQEAYLIGKAKLKLPTTKNLENSILRWLELQFGEKPQELYVYKGNLKTILNYLKNFESSPLESVSEEEILIDMRSQCKYTALVQLSDQSLLFSQDFFAMNDSDKFYVIIETLHLMTANQYSPIGLRAYSFDLFGKNLNSWNDKQIVEARRNAGISYLEKNIAIVDLLKSIQYQGTQLENIEYAYLLDGSRIKTPNGSCRISPTKPAFFWDSNLAKVLLGDNCKLNVGGVDYILKEESFLEFASLGHILSFYLKPNQIIKNENVNLLASSLSDKPSKIVFSDFRKETVTQYIQFTGEVFYRGAWLKIADHYNIGLLYNSSRVSAVVLDSVFPYPVGKNVFWLGGYIKEYPNTNIQQAQVFANINTAKIQDKNLNLEYASTIYFYSTGELWGITIAKDIKLLDSNNKIQQYQKGQTLFLDKSEKIIKTQN